MRKSLLVWATAVTALAIFASQGAGQTAHPRSRTSAAPASGALDVLLRLPDLPGYGLTDGSPLAPLGDVRCDEIDPANPQPELARFLKLNSPVGCFAVYQRVFKAPGGGPEPAFFGSAASRLGSVPAAEEGLAVSDQLLSHVILDEAPEEVPPPVTVGDATRLFHWRHGEIFSEEEEDCSFLLWRSGSTLSAIFVPGRSSSLNDRLAIELAERQQRHVEAPVATKPTEFDDREVALEDPALQLPVYWLGKRFNPGPGLHKLHVEGSWSSPSSKTRASTGLIYTDTYRLGHTEALSLETFTHRQWHRLRRGRGEVPGSLLCSSSESVKVRLGRAVVASGYEPPLSGRPRHPCGGSRPKLFVARVFFPKAVVVAQTMLYCSDTCVRRGHGVYDTYKGMATIARGLEVRRGPSAS